MTITRRFLLGLATALVIGIPAPLVAQDAQLVAQTPSDEWRVSQPARATQRMGSTEMTIVYNRPTARGRELFGALVPWDSIWNPGADEATRIEVDEDITIEGETLPSGRYSIWAIPQQEGDWTLIFSSAWDVQHRPYPEGNEVLQMTVPTETANHVESLAWYFPAADADSAVLALHWGETVVPISIGRP
ncbi:MAG: DUF2911 domain-containing protein [Gemmatimonas sp.]|nr:DUF2911 domain-containing protein [Gemmatimonas sp.]